MPLMWHNKVKPLKYKDTKPFFFIVKKHLLVMRGETMIQGIGIDIIEIDRIANAIKRDLFVQRVFTSGEQLYCEKRGVQRAASYAARFAGKEAVVKAFGTGLVEGSFQDIEILPDAKGCPQVK